MPQRVGLDHERASGFLYFMADTTNHWIEWNVWSATSMYNRISMHVEWGPLQNARHVRVLGLSDTQDQCETVGVLSLSRKHQVHKERVLFIGLVKTNRRSLLFEISLFGSAYQAYSALQPQLKCAINVKLTTPPYKCESVGYTLWCATDTAVIEARGFWSSFLINVFNSKIASRLSNVSIVCHDDLESLAVVVLYWQLHSHVPFLHPPPTALFAVRVSSLFIKPNSSARRIILALAILVVPALELKRKYRFSKVF